MDIVINLLMVLLVALCLLMLLIILMQRPKQEGLGAAFGGGVMDGMLGSGTSNFLQKGTVYLTVGYFVLTMTLAVIQARTSEARSLQGKSLEVSAAEMTPAADDEAAGTEEGSATPPIEPPAPVDGGDDVAPETDAETPTEDAETPVPAEDAATEEVDGTTGTPN